MLLALLFILAITEPILWFWATFCVTGAGNGRDKFCIILVLEKFIPVFHKIIAASLFTVFKGEIP